MPKVVYPIVAFVISFRLSDFVIVMGESQVNAACMNINRVFLEYTGSHCRALNVPAWTTLTPRGLPFGLFRF